MNNELVGRLIGVLEEHPKWYNQESFGVLNEDEPEDWIIEGSCRSPCCIAGHVMVLTGEEVPSEWGDYPVYWGSYIVDMLNELKERASKRLGITFDQGASLFASDWNSDWVDEVEGPLPLIPLSYLTCDKRFTPEPEQAVKVLKRMLNHGFDEASYDDWRRRVSGGNQ